METTPFVSGNTRCAPESGGEYGWVNETYPRVLVFFFPGTEVASTAGRVGKEPKPVFV